MKKLLISTLAAFVLLATGSAFAQTTLANANHDVRITLPNVAFLRFTPDVASRGVYTGTLDLEFALDVAAVQAGNPVAGTDTAANWAT